MEANKQNKNSFRRLKPHIIPQNYKLEINPNFETFKFSGNVTIDIEILKECQVIELNSVGLVLKNINYKSNDEKNCNIEKVESLDQLEIVELHFNEILLTGNGKLYIEFDGVLNDSLQGFYKTKCLNKDGTIGIAGMTQFEASYARRAFPCFDEPQIKATFEITLIAEKHKTVLSNMPIKMVTEFEEDNRFSKFLFEKTPIMSTYLVAYVIGEYDYVEEREITNDTLVRIYTPIGKSQLGKFSLDLTLKALQFFTEYFGLKYPLPKLDLIGLTDVEIEAMENWGLITFKESLVLVDNSNNSIKSKIEVALVVCHEIAHQWFGNIVTMEWWTDLWLNEGFATWIEYLSVDKIFPEWKIWNYYAFDHLNRAYDLDSLKSSHPIEVNVNDVNELCQIFDSISYCKGSAVIRMVNDFIGSDLFVDGLKNYLQKFKYKNATTSDLWKELDLVSKKEINNIMNVWTKQMGYPVVNVTKKINAQKETILCFRQSKFLKNKIDSKDDLNDDCLWNIPITIKTRSSHPNVTKKFLMSSKSVEINIGVIVENDWIKINSDNIGFYRVDYSNEMFADILTHLEKSPTNSGSTLDKYGLISDSFALMWSGKLNSFNWLRLIWSFRNEEDTHVWLYLINYLNNLSACLLDSKCFGPFNSFIKKFIENIVKKVGFAEKPGEDELAKLLRQSTLYLLAKTDDEEFHNFSQKAFMNRSSIRIPADLQNSIYTSIIRKANLETIQEFKNLYNKCENPEEKERIAILLAEVVNDDLINHVLEFSMSSEVTYEEAVFIIVVISKNATCKNSLHLAWNFVKVNWHKIIARYADSVLLGRLLKPMIQNFKSNESIKDVELFFDNNPTPQANLMIAQALEIAYSNVAFLDLQEKNIEMFVKTFA